MRQRLDDCGGGFNNVHHLQLVRPHYQYYLYQHDRREDNQGRLVLFENSRLAISISVLKRVSKVLHLHTDASGGREDRLPIVRG